MFFLPRGSRELGPDEMCNTHWKRVVMKLASIGCLRHMLRDGCLGLMK
jgi:hypothetical protein